MTIVLTQAEYNEIFEAEESEGIAGKTIFEEDGETIIRRHNTYFQNNYEYWLKLSQGMNLRIYRYESLQDFIIQRDFDLSSTNWYDKSLILSFFVTGNMHTHLRGVTQQVEEAAGSSYMEHCPGATETEGWKAGQKILRVQVIIEVAKFFQNISLAHFDGLPPQLQQFATKDVITPFYQQRAIAPEIYPVLQQILNFPYRGKMKQWYLEGKALELMTLQFSQFKSADNSTTQWRSSDVEPIYQAKEILLQNWLDPPSILELAQRVDIYHMKLKQGFKAVFGTTPMQYLRDYRLERARQMLLDERLTVVAVANAVGYANPGHFAASFKRKYGMYPKEMRLR